MENPEPEETSLHLQDSSLLSDSKNLNLKLDISSVEKPKRGDDDSEGENILVDAKF